MLSTSTSSSNTASFQAAEEGAVKADCLLASGGKNHKEESNLQYYLKKNSIKMTSTGSGHGFYNRPTVAMRAGARPRYYEYQMRSQHDVYLVLEEELRSIGQFPQECHELHHTLQSQLKWSQRLEELLFEAYKTRRFPDHHSFMSRVLDSFKTKFNEGTYIKDELSLRIKGDEETVLLKMKTILQLTSELCDQLKSQLEGIEETARQEQKDRMDNRLSQSLDYVLKVKQQELYDVGGATSGAKVDYSSYTLFRDKVLTLQEADQVNVSKLSHDDFPDYIASHSNEDEVDEALAMVTALDTQSEMEDGDTHTHSNAA